MNDNAPRSAEEKHGWFPGWIWAVPVAAVGIVLWLALRSWTEAGPTVEVVFPTIANLRAGDTKVKFQSYDVGTVSEAHIEPDLKHMRVKLNLDTDMKNHLGKGTEFWIAGKSASFSRLSDIKALIEGASVGMIPHPGKQQAHYTGLAQPPILDFGETGSAVTLHSSQLGSIHPGTLIYTLGQQVGKVDRVQMTGGNGFTISAFVNAPYDKLVYGNTRFWRAGPVHIATGGSGVSVQFQGISALLEGAIDFATPASAPRGQPAATGQGFTLYGSEDAAENAPDGRDVVYRVVFHHASGVPQAEAPVTLVGKRIGSVVDANLLYDPQTGSLSVAARIALKPGQVALTSGARWRQPRAQMDDMLRHLVGQGLRAELTSSPPVVGSEQIALKFVPGSGGTLGSGPVPEIPSLSGGSGGISGIESQVNDIMTKVNEMPLPQIAQNLQDISGSVAHLVSSPAMTATLRQVDRSTANLQRITLAMDHDVPPALAQLRSTVAQAQSSLAAAQGLLSARGTTASAPGSAALPQTLYEVTRTARALRELTDFLDQHPSAVLVGRGSGQ